MKKIIAIITIGLITVSAFAQKEQRKHEVSIYAGGGISSLEYDLKHGDHKMGLGGLAGIGYNYFFHYNWSVGVGAEFSLLQAKASFDGKEYQYFSSLNTSQSFDMRFMPSLDEKQKAYYLNVPIRLQFQMDVHKRNKFYAAIGAKVGYAMMSAKAETEGKYSIKGWEYRDNQIVSKDPFENLDPFFPKDKPVNMDREFDLADLNIIGTLELGMKFPVASGKNAWYAGVFCDYGFSDVRPESSVVRPKYYENMGSRSVIETDFVDKVNTLTFGAKVGFAFGLGAKHVILPPEEKPYEGLTADQLEKIMGKNTGDLIDAMDRNFNELFDKLKKEEPELFEPIPSDVFALVQFDFDRDNVKPVYYPEIDKKVEILKRYPEVRMTLIGHTDDRGSEAYNYNLGMERAQQVKDYMVRNGIAADRLFVESRGKSQPLYPNSTEENRYKNRRVEFEMKK